MRKYIMYQGIHVYICMYVCIMNQKLRFLRHDEKSRGIGDHLASETVLHDRIHDDLATIHIDQPGFQTQDCVRNDGISVNYMTWGFQLENWFFNGLIHTLLPVVNVYICSE